MNENIKNIAETIRKALTIEVGSCHTDSIPLDERSGKIVAFYSKELATALDKAGYHCRRRYWLRTTAQRLLSRGWRRDVGKYVGIQHRYD